MPWMKRATAARTAVPLGVYANEQIVARQINEVR